MADEPQAIAELAKQFITHDEFGRWLVPEIERRIQHHRDLAEGSDAHNLTINHTMKASGLIEALKLITDNARMADSPLFKKK